MTKENVSASVDPEVAAYLSKESVNASGTINQLVKQQMSAGNQNRAVLEMRLKQLNSQIERREDELDNLRRERDALETQLENMDEAADEVRREQLRQLKQVPDDPSHPLVQEVAEELGISPEEALEEADEL